MNNPLPPGAPGGPYPPPQPQNFLSRCACVLYGFLMSHLWLLGLVVATDDEKIAECCRGFGANVIMTSESCQNGSSLVFTSLQNLP